MTGRHLPALSSVATIALLWLVAPQAAEEAEPGFWSFEIENDLWGSQEDRFYTSGWQFSYASPQPPPAYLDRVSELIPFYSKG